MNDIYSIYDMLNRKNTPEVRSQGIRLAEKIDNLAFLIQPPACPSVWECCAEILARKPDVVLEPYLGDLLKWLQDLNWPGAVVILDRLKTFSGEKLKNPFVCSFNYAVNSNSEEDQMWISYLALLLDNVQLKNQLPNEIIEKLQIGGKGAVLLSPDGSPMQQPIK